jgi:hypothetical protein
MNSDWKYIQMEGLSSIERLVDEYSILTYNIAFYIRFRVYERMDDFFYAVAGITIKNSQTGEFIRPYGEGNSSYQALRNALIQYHELIISLNEELKDFQTPGNFNFVISESHEY